MKLDTEFYKLPLRFDVARMTQELEQFSEEDWRAHPQGHVGNTAISLIAVHGNHTNDSPKGPMRPTKFLERCPYLQQVLAAFDTVFGRTRLMRIEGEADANAHIDTNYYWLQRVRVHVPVVTFPEVEYVCGGKSVNMAAGESWIFDTYRMHNSINRKPTPRIHLVADTTGSDYFWDLVSKAERPFSPNPNAAAPTFISYDPNLKPQIQSERINFPVVMSPTEQDSLLNDILGDLDKSPNAPPDQVSALKESLAPFRRQWRSLWSQFGDTAEGFPRYKRLLDEVQFTLSPYAKKLALPNKMEAIEIILQAVVRSALNPELATTPSAASDVAPAPAPIKAPSMAGLRTETPPSISRLAPPLPMHVPPTTQAPSSAAQRSSARFERPVFIVAAPRSGSSLLFETLARSPDFWTVGGESHGLFENIQKLHPANRNFESNRLSAADADPQTAELLRTNIRAALRDRNKRSVPESGSLRMLEKTPKNALRIPFINAVFPDALFIYLYREPHENVSSIMEAWKSRKFTTYPNLPGWQSKSGLPWSLLLIPQWRELTDSRLVDIAAAQWAVANTLILDDLEQLSPERWCCVTYSDLLAKPQEEAQRLCDFVGVGWDQKLEGKLPNSQHTLTPPDPEKWRKNAAAIETVIPKLQAVADRVRETASGHIEHPTAHFIPSTAAPAPKAAASSIDATSQPSESPMAHDVPPGNPNPVPPANAEPQDPKTSPLRSVHTTSLPQILQQLGVSLLVSTYQAGKLIIARVLDGKLNTHFRNFMSPMGVAADGSRLALGTLNQVWEFRNQPDVGPKLEPKGKVDACYMPRNSHFTGDIKIHEIAWSGDDLWIVNTRFSCLCTLDARHSFIPRWRPKFVSGLAPEDRCHLNGMAMHEGKPRYVTALGETDDVGGWRANKANGGILIDVASNEIVARGLSMPHSPRVYNGKLWVLESGHGRISTVDPATGQTTTVAEVPGFTRGLDFVGPYAFIGLSQVRETAVFSGLPITEKLKDRTCGVWVVDIRNGAVVGFIRFEDAVQEIFAVQALPGIRFPDIVNDDNDIIGNSFVLPDEALKQVQIRKQ